MKLIAHRGNLHGPCPARENSIEYIREALDAGVDVEIDVWRMENGDFLLGHDEPQYKVTPGFLLMTSGLWCHAKNLEALQWMLENGVHCFWHQEDDYTITSKGKIWAYPGKKTGNNVIVVMPEWKLGAVFKLPENCDGICSDYVGNFLDSA